MRIQSKINDYHVVFSNNIENKYDYYVIDKIVYELYAKEFSSIDKAKILLIEADEQNKEYVKCASYIKILIDMGLKRGHRIGAFGGGVVQDICGYMCSIIYRGIKWDFYPTTLLAQCDSCIGGKTSINMGPYKNIVGNFYPPEKIIINHDFLKTLSKDEIQSGIGEIIKVAFIDNSNRISHNKLIHCIENAQVDNELVKLSLEIKKEIIELDEFDTGIRNILNYGHTFGHAIESMTSFKIPHGIAVGFGIFIANEVSKRFYEDSNLDNMQKVVNEFLQQNKYFFKYFIDNYNGERYLNCLKRDKKNQDANNIKCILAKDSGRLEKINMSPKYLKRVLKDVIIKKKGVKHVN